MKLSQQIETDLQHFVSRGECPPYRLTLSAIAEHFGTSIQPVRTAVDTLLKSHWLLRDAQHQLAINPSKRGKTIFVKPQEDDKAADVETGLTDEVLRMSLRGESAFLREEETAGRLNVGRAIIRDILGRMTGRGFVEHVPRRGWRVCPFSREQMNEYIELREMLEMRAMKLSMGRMQKKELERLLERNSPSKSGRVRIDNALHAYWIKTSGNRYISEFFSRHGQYYAMLFDYATLEKSVLAEMAEQHREMLLALLAGSLKAAQNVLHKHIQLQHPNVSYLMEHYGKR